MADDTAAYQTAVLTQMQRLEKVLASSGERRVGAVWEYTQSLIAVLVVITTCLGVFVLSVWHQDIRMPPEWWTIVGLVIGFYFGRVRPPSPAPVRSGQERTRSSDGKPNG